MASVDKVAEAICPKKHIKEKENSNQPWLYI